MCILVQELYARYDPEEAEEIIRIKDDAELAMRLICMHAVYNYCLAGKPRRVCDGQS